MDLVVAVHNGAFSVRLEPNVDGTAYLVRWEMDGAKARSELWVVTASATPLRVSDVLATSVASIVRVLLSQIDPRGGSEGQCIKLTGGVPSWANCGSATGRTWTWTAQ